MAAPQQRTIRRGLPRVRGGEPWPPADPAPANAAIDTTPAPAAARSEASAPATPVSARRPEADAASPAPPAADPPPASRLARRGLPRIAGGEPWPPPTAVPERWLRVAAAEEPALPAAPPKPATEPTAEDVVPTPTALPAPAVSTRRRPPFWESWPVLTVRIRVTWLALIGVLLVLATAAVLIARGLLTVDVVQDFLAQFPGEYELPDVAPVGLPAWIGWQHFLNAFLIVLIIRSGLQVRGQKRPPAYWSPRWNPQRKISLTLWLHQSLDVLWLVNGAVFVVLLFVTGQWMRIVPTSWAVFPNAASALLQYLSLDWPTENGWANYNALQQLSYFTTVFVAAPLAALTGVRMSGLWPKDARTLNRLYPVEWARAIHFPVMLYFILFIFVHVALVLATGALRNLNHMYGSQDAVNWVGFWIFLGSVVVMAAGWLAARPLVVAPIARLLGKVSQR